MLIIWIEKKVLLQFKINTYILSIYRVVKFATLTTRLSVRIQKNKRVKDVFQFLICYWVPVYFSFKVFEYTTALRKAHASNKIWFLMSKALLCQLRHSHHPIEIVANA